MRLGRILLAGLTALAAYSYAQTAPKPDDAHASLRFLQAVVPILVHSADSVSPAPVVKSVAHAMFRLEALAATSLSGSICLLASIFAVNLLARCRRRSLLRC